MDRLEAKINERMTANHYEIIRLQNQLDHALTEIRESIEGELDSNVLIYHILHELPKRITESQIIRDKIGYLSSECQTLHEILCEKEP